MTRTTFENVKLMILLTWRITKIIRKVNCFKRGFCRIKDM